MAWSCNCDYLMCDFPQGQQIIWQPKQSKQWDSDPLKIWRFLQAPGHDTRSISRLTRAKLDQWPVNSKSPIAPMMYRLRSFLSRVDPSRNNLQNGHVVSFDHMLVEKPALQIRETFLN